MSETSIRADMNYVGTEQAVPVEVTVNNGRVQSPGPWEETGFELRSHHSAVTDWDDADEIARVHYDEISRFAKEITGCDYALVGSHIRRNPDQASSVHEQLSPITFVHSDFAPSYRDVVLGTYRNPKEATLNSLERAGIAADDVEKAARMVILQFWRNTGPQKMDFPIAFCDARTVGQEELAVIDVNDYAGSGVNFQALAVKRPADPAKHAWYSYPNMNRDEVVIFRTYDSAMVDGGQPFWTPHSAFRDPDVAVGQPSRRSIELRATCLYMS